MERGEKWWVRLSFCSLALEMVSVSHSEFCVSCTRHILQGLQTAVEAPVASFPSRTSPDPQLESRVAHSGAHTQLLCQSLHNREECPVEFQKIESLCLLSGLL